MIGVGSRERGSRPIVTVTTNTVDYTILTVTVASGIEQSLTECVLEPVEQGYRPEFHSKMKPVDNLPFRTSGLLELNHTLQ